MYLYSQAGVCTPTILLSWKWSDYETNVDMVLYSDMTKIPDPSLSASFTYETGANTTDTNPATDTRSYNGIVETNIATSIGFTPGNVYNLYNTATIESGDYFVHEFIHSLENQLSMDFVYNGDAIIAQGLSAQDNIRIKVSSTQDKISGSIDRTDLSIFNKQTIIVTLHKIVLFMTYGEPELNRT